MSQSKLYIYDYGICLLAYGIENEKHGHYAASLLVGLDGPLTVEFEDSSIIEGRIIVLGPNTVHALRTEAGARTVVIQWDLDSYIYPPIPGLETQPFLSEDTAPGLYSRFFETNIKNSWERAFGSDSKCMDIAVLMGQTLAGLNAVPAEAAPNMDSRLKSVIDYLNTADLTETIPLGDVAAKAGLSEDRLMRLFRSELGLPYRRFLLWLKIRRAALSLGNGGNLTDAAHKAGFADSAHLSRTFKEMFGSKPSLFFGNPGFIQVNYCGSG